MFKTKTPSDDPSPEVQATRTNWDYEWRLKETLRVIDVAFDEVVLGRELADADVVSDHLLDVRQELVLLGAAIGNTATEGLTTEAIPLPPVTTA